MTQSQPNAVCVNNVIAYKNHHIIMMDTSIGVTALLNRAHEFHQRSDIMGRILAYTISTRWVQVVLHGRTTLFQAV